MTVEFLLKNIYQCSGLWLYACVSFLHLIFLNLFKIRIKKLMSNVPYEMINSWRPSPCHLIPGKLIAVVHVASLFS